MMGRLIPVQADYGPPVSAVSVPDDAAPSQSRRIRLIASEP